MYFSSHKCSVKFSSVMGPGLTSVGNSLGRCVLSYTSLMSSGDALNASTAKT